MPPFRRDTIKDLRQSLSMSQREFADHLGVPQTTVARWETGRTTPSADYLGLMYDLARRHTRPFAPFAEATPARERVEIAQVAATEWLRKSKGPRGKDVVPWAETFHQMLGLIAAARRELRPVLDELEGVMKEPSLGALEGLLGQVQRELGAAEAA